MATDYDAPRRNEADELGEDSLEELKARRAEAQSSSVDVDETDFNENLELPGADLSDEELTVRVLPKQEDEFTCSRCFRCSTAAGSPPPGRPAVLPRLRLKDPPRHAAGAEGASRPRAMRAADWRARDVPPPRPVARPAGAGRRGRAGPRGPRRRRGRRRSRRRRRPPRPRRSTGRRPGRGAGLRDVAGRRRQRRRRGPRRGARGRPRPPGPGRRPASTGRSRARCSTTCWRPSAPRLPVRDAARLRAAYPGSSDEEIAAALVARAARLTAGIGAATGGLAAAHWIAPPSLLACPLELGVETVLIAAVEVVLSASCTNCTAGAPGDARARGAAYLAGWSAQRAARARPASARSSAPRGLRTLRRRVGRRLVRNVPTAAPLLLGAALAGRGNRRATETLAERVLRDLRGRA